MLAALLVIHALATPGVLIGANGLVQAAGALNLPVGVLGLLTWRAARTYLLTRRVSDLVVTVGVVWLIGGRVRALMVRLADKDPSTEGHTRRVATLAVSLGEQLGLPDSRLRQLALGGLLHDMGKLSVPDAILNKPGKLTDEEFGVIRRHPGWGRELLSELGGFPEDVLQLVESHHERIDARGYPHRRAAAELPLEVRILTVADVYDALTADRVYREAWTPERALEVIFSDTGSAFDERCAVALRDLVGPSIAEAAAPGWQLGFATGARAAAATRPRRRPSRAASELQTRSKTRR